MTKGMQMRTMRQEENNKRVMNRLFHDPFYGMSVGSEIEVPQRTGDDGNQSSMNGKPSQTGLPG